MWIIFPMNLGINLGGITLIAAVGIVMSIGELEPGSGSTIMGYAGVCSPNVQSNSDPYFHSINFEEMRAFVESGGGASCDVELRLPGMRIPTADAGADYTIPHSTPFVLTGSASDSDDDSLTYSWEQIDENAALFRVYNPVSSPSRYFPKIRADLWIP